MPEFGSSSAADPNQVRGDGNTTSSLFCFLQFDISVLAFPLLLATDTKSG